MNTAHIHCLTITLVTLAAPALGSDLSGFPTGLWKLNETDSKSMGATSQTLEILTDDGQKLSFVLRQKGADGTTVLKWSGIYGQAPHPVEGSAITLAVAHGPNQSIRIFGQRPGGISYQEVCHVAPSKRHFRCDGSQLGSDGKRTAYVENYDLQS
jgi:hypothetical protein